MSRRPKRKAGLRKAVVGSSGKPVVRKDSSGKKLVWGMAALNDRWKVVGVCIFLAVVIWTVFGQTLHDQFVNYDDNLHVYDNPAVKSGLTVKSIEWAFKFSHTDYWHPLDFLSHMLDCQLYGLAPAGHHLTNVLIHTVTAILLFLMLWRMTGFLWRSAFVAAVFAIHPLRVESVAWISERKDVLSGMFFMLTLGAYVRYVRHSWSLLRYLAVVLLFTLGLMSKPTIMTLPFVLLLLDYWPLRRYAPLAGRDDAGQIELARWPRARLVFRLVIEKLPLFVLSAASCVQAAIGNGPAFEIDKKLPEMLQVSNAVVSYVVYIGQMIWPVKLAVFYPFPMAGLPLWEVIGATALLVFVTVCVFVLHQRHPHLLVGWLWYLGMLVPMIGFVQAGSIAHADRYTYLPQIGLYVLLTWTAAKLCVGWRWRSWMLGGLSMVILVALIIRAHAQTAYWRNSITLWTHTLACTSDNALAHNNLGDVLLLQGDVDGAITQFHQALQINPDYVMARNNLGNALLQQGRVDEAIIQDRKALELKPDLATAHYNLANALLQRGRAGEATSQFRQALKINPDYVEAWNNLGVSLLQRDEVDEAINCYQKALRLKPDYVKAQDNLGYAYFKKGKVDEAIICYRKALRLKPDYAEACSDLGAALLRAGKTEEAVSSFQRALAFKPDFPEAQNGLAWILATSSQASQRDGKQAVELALHANRLTGGENPVFLRTLAAAYAEDGRFGDAQRSVQRALHLAQAAGQSALVEQLRGDLKLYAAGFPLHQGAK